MSLTLILAILTAAFFHALWNGLLKGGKDPLLDSMNMCVVWFVISLAFLPFLPIPHLDSWPFAAGSVILHILYFFFLAHCYRLGDLTIVYPIIRGTPPILVALVSLFFLQDVITPLGWVGLLTISCGVLTMAFNKKHLPPHLLLAAFITACFIAGYTITDGSGARLSGNSMGYLMWYSVIQAAIYIAIVVRIRGLNVCVGHTRLYWKRAAIGGTISHAAYAIVIWACTLAPLAYVSALRETSVLMAMLIGVVLLGEELTKQKIIAALLILCGISLLRFA